MKIQHAVLAAVTVMLAACASTAQSTPAEQAKAQLTRQPYALRATLGGQDMTQRLGVVQVRYLADGSIERTLADGKQGQASWRLLDADAKTMETVGPEGTSRWQVLELSPSSFRKRNLDNGMEIIHTPVKK